MRGSIKVFFIIIFSLSFGNSFAQGFDAAVLMGFNAAQIDGDGLVGYHKVGLHTGLRVSYPIRAKTDLGLELLYSQRGSRSAYDIPGDQITQTTLNYIAIPVFINYKDWYVEEDDMYKVKGEAGLSYGYLFRTKTDNIILEEDLFKQNDLSIHLGVGYAFNKKWSFGARWTRALLYLYQSPLLPNVKGAVSYYLTFRLEYNL